MKCAEARELIGLYLDSELDARAAREMRQHLQQCAACAGLCRAENDFETTLQAKLKAPTKTASLWLAEEAFVAEAFRRRERMEPDPASAGPTLAGWVIFCRDLLWPSPRYYAGLAAVWLLLFVLRPAAPAPARPTAARPHGLSPATRLVLLEQRRELQQLLETPEPATRPTAEKATAPRSERKKANGQSADRDRRSLPT